MTELQRIVNVWPAYDCEVTPCGKNGCGTRAGASHGRHNAELHLTVRGDRAEVTLAVGTGWDLPETPAAMRAHGLRGLFVQFHSADPQHDDDDASGGTCPLWTPCYIDTGFSMADEPTDLLVRKGSDAVWDWLTEQHHRRWPVAAAEVTG